MSPLFKLELRRQISDCGIVAVLILDRVEEALRWLFRKERARVGAQVFDAVLAKPALHFPERVPVLLGVLVLIAQPGEAPRGLGGAIAQHRIEGHDAGQPVHRAAEPQGRPDGGRGDSGRSPGH